MIRGDNVGGGGCSKRKKRKGMGIEFFLVVLLLISDPFFLYLLPSAWTFFGLWRVYKQDDSGRVLVA